MLYTNTKSNKTRSSSSNLSLSAGINHTEVICNRIVVIGRRIISHLAYPNDFRNGINSICKFVTREDCNTQ